MENFGKLFLKVQHLMFQGPAKMPSDSFPFYRNGRTTGLSVEYHSILIIFSDAHLILQTDEVEEGKQDEGGGGR